ncbi:MAG: molybdopterin-synthase adenylyltransferase MoeB [Kofleriaceae bacterium]|nr:molybdopterin-synthase adenylyltransferase MoeB [Kofleriaceae bacterium]
MPSAQSYIARVKATIHEVAPTAATLPTGVVVIDVRERDEFVAGALPQATWIARGFLETQIEAAVPDRATPIVLYCAGGTRSALAARTLGELGYRNVSSMAGGFSAYKAAGLPWQVPAALDVGQHRRFARHLRLTEVGEAGQQRLLTSKVLLLGAGGLGSPCALYLAAAGVGTLGLVDDDVVDESNLQRQVLHTTGRVGMRKVDSAEVALRELWPGITLHKHAVRLTAENALALMADYDVIVDGSDNFATRYVVNDAAVRVGKAVVHASVFRFEGQLTVFPAGGQPCYRCVFPVPPPPGQAPSCSEAGVLGVLPGVLGVLQATETIKLLLGIGDSMAGRLWVYDALAARFHQLTVRADPTCRGCGSGRDDRRPLGLDDGAACA